MKITISTDIGEFDLEIDITHIEPFEPARLVGHPDSYHDSSGGDIDYDIESAIPKCYESMKIDFKDWVKLSDEEKEERSKLTIKSINLRNGNMTESEHEKILEAIDKELKLEAKYAMEP